MQWLAPATYSKPPGLSPTKSRLSERFQNLNVYGRALASVGDSAPIGGRAARPQPSPTPMGMDRDCRHAGRHRRRLVSVPVARVARDLRAMHRRPRDLGRCAVRARLHFRHHFARPEWPLTIVAGLLYGVWGAAITVVTATVAASVTFLIARYLARAKVHPLLELAADIFRDRRRSRRGRLGVRRAAAPRPLDAIQSSELRVRRPLPRSGTSSQRP